jgi:ABC-type dipeptide/oligopeptide/nickel transport system permease subunit
MSKSKPDIVTIDAQTVTSTPTSLWQVAFRRIFRRRSSIIGMTMLAALILVAIFADFIAPYDPIEVLIDSNNHVVAYKPICIHLLGCPADQTEYIMGTDGNGRDLFSRVVFGARLSLTVGIASVGFAIVIGALLGAAAGYMGGWVDVIVMRLMDVLLAFPSLLLAIAIVGALGRGSLLNALIAIGIVSIPVYARVIRASVLALKEQDFIEASRSLGASHWHILFQRIMPNSLTPIIVTGTLGIATAILDAAALSFIGFGAQPPDPEWGSMLGKEFGRYQTNPNVVFFPGLAIMITVLAFNLLGDGLRDALDPRLARNDLGAGG